MPAIVVVMRSASLNAGTTTAVRKPRHIWPPCSSSATRGARTFGVSVRTESPRGSSCFRCQTWAERLKRSSALAPTADPKALVLGVFGGGRVWRRLARVPRRPQSQGRLLPSDLGGKRGGARSDFSVHRNGRPTCGFYYRQVPRAVA